MIVGLTYDVKTDWVIGENDPADLNAEFDKPQTIDDISRALEYAGHQVKRIGNVWNLLSKIDDLGDTIYYHCSCYQNYQDSEHN